MEIRRATAADAAVLRRFWEESSAEIDFAPYPGAPWEDSLLREHVALLADEDGEPLGAVYANLASEHFGYVFGLYVARPARRRGVAGELMRAVARVLADEGRGHVVLSVDTPNEAGRALYERLGFEEASRLLRIETRSLLTRG